MKTEEAAMILDLASKFDEVGDFPTPGFGAGMGTVLRTMLGEIQRLGEDVKSKDDYIAHLEAQRGGAVVVPELTAGDLSSAIDIESGRFGDAVNIPNTLEALNKILRDRVLGDGMVGVDREELGALREIAGRWCPPFGVPHNMETIALFDRLRIAKGEKRT